MQISGLGYNVRSAPLVCLLFLWTFVQPSGEEEDASQFVREALADTLRFFRTEPMELSVAATVIYEHDFTQGFTGEHVPAGEPVVKETAHFRRQGELFLYEGRVWNAGYPEGEFLLEEKAAHNGLMTRSLHVNHERPHVPPQGSQSNTRRDIDKVLLVKSDTGGFLMGVQPGMDLLTVLGAEATEFSVLPEKEEIGGRPCFVVEIDGEDSRHRLWLDPERGFNYLQWECSLKEGKSVLGMNTAEWGTWKVTDVGLKNVDGVWVPISGRQIREGGAGYENETWYRAASIERIELGKSYTDADFFFDFPAGAWVSMRPGGKFEVKADGSMVPLAERTQELVKGLAEELSASARQDTPASTNGGSGHASQPAQRLVTPEDLADPHPHAVLIAVIVFAVLLSAVVLFSRRRQKRGQRE